MLLLFDETEAVRDSRERLELLKQIEIGEPRWAIVRRDFVVRIQADPVPWWHRVSRRVWDVLGILAPFAVLGALLAWRSLL